MTQDPLSTTMSVYNIRAEAQREWDKKTQEERLKKGKSYNHIFTQRKFKCNDWSLPFAKLTKRQRNILIKGSLIRKYDELDNQTKTWIKNKFELSSFASKWYRLPSADKQKILKAYITNG